MAGGDDDAVAWRFRLIRRLVDGSRDPKRLKGGAAILRKQPEGVKNHHLLGFGLYLKASAASLLGRFIGCTDEDSTVLLGRQKAALSLRWQHP